MALTQADEEKENTDHDPDDDLSDEEEEEEPEPPEIDEELLAYEARLRAKARLASAEGGEENEPLDRDGVLRHLSAPYIQYMTSDQREQEKAAEERRRWQEAERAAMEKGDPDVIRRAQQRDRALMLENAKQTMAKRAAERTKKGQLTGMKIFLDRQAARRAALRKEERAKDFEKQKFVRSVFDGLRAFFFGWTKMFTEPAIKIGGHRIDYHPRTRSNEKKSLEKSQETWKNLPNNYAVQVEVGLLSPDERAIIERDLKLEKDHLERINMNKDAADKSLVYKLMPEGLKPEVTSDNTYEPQNRLVNLTAQHFTHEPPKLAEPVWPKHVRTIRTPELVRNTETKRWFRAYEERNRYLTKVSYEDLPVGGGLISEEEKCLFSNAPVSYASFLVAPPDGVGGPDGQDTGFKKQVWVRRTSRRHSGFGYWVNTVSGETKWDSTAFPQKQDRYYEATRWSKVPPTPDVPSRRFDTVGPDDRLGRSTASSREDEFGQSRKKLLGQSSLVPDVDEEEGDGSDVGEELLNLSSTESEMKLLENDRGMD
eukprot:g14626.t1